MKHKLFSERGVALVVEAVTAGVAMLAIATSVYFVVQNHHKVTTTVTPATSSTAPPATTPAASATACTPDQTMYVTATSGLNLRADKSPTANITAKMPWATQVKAGCKDGDWDKVSYGSQAGYSLVQYLDSKDPSLFIIKEWGVQMKIPVILAGLTYKLRDPNQYGQVADFSSTDLAVADKSCTPDQSPMGSVAR